MGPGDVDKHFSHRSQKLEGAHLLPPLSGIYIPSPSSLSTPHSDMELQLPKEAPSIFEQL